MVCWVTRALKTHCSHLEFRAAAMVWLTLPAAKDSLSIFCGYQFPFLLSSYSLCLLKFLLFSLFSFPWFYPPLLVRKDFYLPIGNYNFGRKLQASEQCDQKERHTQEANLTSWRFITPQNSSSSSPRCPLFLLYSQF